MLCGCYSCEGFHIINLSQANPFIDKKKRVCLFFHFANSFVQETAYALWLEDQRKALHEKAALYLEKSSQKCRSCGGNGFVPGHGRGVSISEQLKYASARKFSCKYHASELFLIYWIVCSLFIFNISVPLLAPIFNSP